LSVILGKEELLTNMHFFLDFATKI
jgi:hypothetical protein